MATTKKRVYPPTTFTKGDVSYTLTDQVQIRAFRGKGVEGWSAKDATAQEIAKARSMTGAGKSTNPRADSPGDRDNPNKKEA